MSRDVLNGVSLEDFLFGAVPVALLSGVATPMIAFTSWTVMVPLLFSLYKMNSPITVFFVVGLDFTNALVALLCFALLPGFRRAPRSLDSAATSETDALLGAAPPSSLVNWRFVGWHALFFLLAAVAPALVGGVLIAPSFLLDVSHTQLAHRGVGFIDYAIAAVFVVRALLGCFTPASRQLLSSAQPSLSYRGSTASHASAERSSDSDGFLSPAQLSDALSLNSSQSLSYNVDLSHSDWLDDNDDEPFSLGIYRRYFDLDQIRWWSRRKTVRFWACFFACFFCGLVCALLGCGGGMMFVLCFILAEKQHPFPATVGGCVCMLGTAALLLLASVVYMDVVSFDSYLDYWARFALVLLAGAVGTVIGGLIAQRLVGTPPLMINITLAVLLLVVGTLSFIIPVI